MKRLLTLFLLIIPILSCAHENESIMAATAPKAVVNKYYIKPTQIGFSQDKIFVNFDGDWQPVKAIFADKDGLYIAPDHFPWKCKECSVNNEFFRPQCKTADCPGKRPPKFSIPKPPSPTLPFPLEKYPLPPHLQKPTTTFPIEKRLHFDTASQD